LFALHPLRVESVAWVSERKDVLSGFFGILTMLSHVHYVRHRSPSRYALTLLLFALGLMAKPMLVTLPFVLLLLDFWPLQRSTLQTIPSLPPQPSFTSSLETPSQPLVSLLIEKIPFLVLSAASSVITFVVQHKAGAVSGSEIVPLTTRIGNALVSYCAYLGKLFWPSNLAVFYPHPGHELPLWDPAAAALFLLALSLLVIFQAQRRPFLVTGWFWFLGMLVPVIGIIQVGGQSMADRYTYLPSIGIFIMVAWTPPSLPWRIFHQRLLLATGLSVVLIFLSIATWVQTGYWKDTGAVFGHALSVTTNNHLAHCFLGDVLASENKLDQAQSEHEKALAIWPRFAEAHNGLGRVLAKRGFRQEAMSHFEIALREKPNFASAHLSVANELAESGDLEGALSHYSEALRINPDSVDAHSGLGVMMARTNRLPEALSHLTTATQLCPRCPEPHNNLGRVFTLLGNINEAAGQFQQAIQLDPTLAEAYNNMGLIYFNLGALEEASYYFSAALHFKSDYAKARLNLKRVAVLIAQSKGTAKEDVSILDQSPSNWSFPPYP
jgi:tetratricopeptide (TPR) repeat protein